MAQKGLLYWQLQKAIYNSNVKLGLWMKVDASRRRNDPRKLDKELMSMVRYRC